MKRSRLHASTTPCPDVVLCDLNFTLVDNSDATMLARAYDRETHRSWLVDVLRRSGSRVALITVRPSAYRQTTLRRIADRLDGWQPHEAHFNDRGLSAVAWKEHVLRKKIGPRFSPARMLAIESNAAVHVMYERAGVAWVKVGPDDRWPSLPVWDVPDE